MKKLLYIFIVVLVATSCAPTLDRMVKNPPNQKSSKPQLADNFIFGPIKL